MSETTTAPSTSTPRKCWIDEVFDPGFIELLRLVPRNRYVRALILKLTGKMPGSECGTFEEIKEWVELNCEKRTKSSLGGRSTARGIAVAVDFSEVESGRAAYAVDRSGREDFVVSAEDLLEMVRETIVEDEGLDQIVERIADKIDQDGWTQCQPDLETFGDYEYSDHDAGDSSDSKTSYSRVEIRQAVLAFLRQRHPELANELEGTT